MKFYLITDDINLINFFNKTDYDFVYKNINYDSIENGILIVDENYYLPKPNNNNNILETWLYTSSLKIVPNIDEYIFKPINEDVLSIKLNLLNNRLNKKIKKFICPMFIFDFYYKNLSDKTCIINNIKDKLYAINDPVDYMENKIKEEEWIIRVIELFNKDYFNDINIINRCIYLSQVYTEIHIDIPNFNCNLKIFTLLIMSIIRIHYKQSNIYINENYIIYNVNSVIDGIGSNLLKYIIDNNDHVTLEIKEDNVYCKWR